MTSIEFRSNFRGPKLWPKAALYLQKVGVDVTRACNENMPWPRDHGIPRAMIGSCYFVWKKTTNQLPCEKFWLVDPEQTSGLSIKLCFFSVAWWNGSGSSRVDLPSPTESGENSAAGNIHSDLDLLGKVWYLLLDLYRNYRNTASICKPHPSWEVPMKSRQLAGL